MFRILPPPVSHGSNVGEREFALWAAQHPFTSQETLHNESSSFDFNSMELPGEHSLCFQTNSSHWWGNEQIKFHLDVETGVDAKASTNPWEAPAAELESIQAIEKHVELLKAKMAEIKHTSENMIEREHTFRMTSDSTFRRVWLSAVVQGILLVALAMWQVNSITQMLKERKLV